jgi:DNA-binding beta-propeller fold protein YncE
MRSPSLAGCGIAALLALSVFNTTARAQLMIVGNDAKPKFDDGKVVMQAPGHDTLSIIDMSKPAELRIVATIPLDNTIVGPPVNLAITPARDIALVANTMKAEAKDNGFAMTPDNRLFVVDLKANPPAVVLTLTLGNAPSGLAISADGKMALVANREGGSVSALSINGKDVKVTDTVAIGAPADLVSAVAIAPDGKRALAVKSGANKVAVLNIDNGKITYDKDGDLPANNYPYNVAVTPNGEIALVANTGNKGSSDGNADTVSVIDLTANPIRVVDHITVGDSPEGLAISPKGNLAITVEARGSNRSKSTWYYHPGGAISLLQIDGKHVTRVGEVTVGGLPEGAVFSADGSHIYVGNFMDSDLSVLTVAGDKVTDTGQRFKLPGQPASIRAGPQ